MNITGLPTVQTQALDRPSGPVSPGPQAPPQPALRSAPQVPQDQVLMVSFGATDLETNVGSMPVMEPVRDKGTVKAFLTANGSRQPQAISRVGEYYIIQLDAHTTLKTTGAMLEQAIRDKAIAPNSGL